MRIKKIKTIYLLIIILATAISPLVASANGINYLLIIFGIIFIILKFKYFRFFSKYHLGIVGFAFAFFASILINIRYLRISSFFYTLFFLMLFYLIINLVRKQQINPKYYIRTIELIIWAYFIILLTQQIMYFSGTSIIFNKLGSEEWRLNSLALEPSLVGITINALFISYLRMKAIEKNRRYSLSDLRNDKYLFFAYTYTAITCGSAFSLILLFLTFSYFQNIKNMIFLYLLFFALFIFSYQLEFKPSVRLINIFLLAETGDHNLMLSSDMSAGVRIIPVLQYLENINLLSLDFWFGKGMTFSSTKLSEFLGFQERQTIGWFFPSFLIDHGFISFSLFLYLLYKNSIKNILSVETFFFLVIIINISLNNQFFWFVIIIFTINKYFMATNKINDLRLHEQ